MARLLLLKQIGLPLIQLTIITIFILGFPRDPPSTYTNLTTSNPRHPAAPDFSKLRACLPQLHYLLAAP